MTGPRIAAALIAALAVTFTVAVGASGAPKRASGTLQLKATFSAVYQFGDTSRPRWADCPSAVPVDNCILFVGEAVVPGLGRATASYTKTEQNGCSDVRQFSTAVIDVAGKGAIHLAMAEPEPVCAAYAPSQAGPLRMAITGGSGAYAGASGGGQFETTVYGPTGCRPNCRGPATDTWTLSLTVPGLDFDLTAPVLSGAVSKTVRAPKARKRVRVRYTVTAKDGVDGRLAAVCTPRSGTLFKVGRTTVACSAVDSSGNTGKARFTIAVKS